MKKALVFNDPNKKLYYRDGNGKIIFGVHAGINDEIEHYTCYGDCTKLSGDLSELEGDISNIYGNVYNDFLNDFLYGDCTNLHGNITGVIGCADMVSGNLDECAISDEERKTLINIEDLVVNFPEN